MKKVFVLPMIAALSLATTVGCATKKYVRNETAPTINKVNELDELTAKTTNDIKDVDARAQQGIQGVNQKAAQADQRAAAANQRAGEAQQLASTASTRVDQIATQVANFDNYRPVTEATVHFGFDKASLTKQAKEALDEMANGLQQTRNYIIVVNGNTDPVGPAEYNYQLSRRRADAVVNYLAAKYNVPAHKFYIIGLGEDKPAEEGRGSKVNAENRRVDVQLMTNIQDQGAQPGSQAQEQQQTPPSAAAAPQSR
ncbi:MAG TPA: OmpA family protein [Terriglobales bacterium]|nr:OmpA family protein [Terriglobales bacterium]